MFRKQIRYFESFFFLKIKVPLYCYTYYYCTCTLVHTLIYTRINTYKYTLRYIYADGARTLCACVLL